MTLAKLITFWELKGFLPHQYDNERLSDTLNGELRKIHIQKNGYYTKIFYILSEAGTILMLSATIYDAALKPSFNNQNIHIKNARVKDIANYFS